LGSILDIHSDVLLGLLALAAFALGVFLAYVLMGLRF
jgi:hypothetical protein